MTKRTVRPKAKPMTKRTLTNLAQRIRKSHELATTGLLAALAHARDAGTLLREAKQHFEHGEWLPWLKSQVGLSARTAQTYMRISLRWRELEAKTQRVADLPLREATKLLAAPSRASGPEYENETDPKARWMKFDQWADAMTVGWESDLAVVNQIVDSPTSTVRQLVFAHDIAHQMSNATHEIELRCMREMGLILNDWESMGLDIHWIVNHLTEFRAGLKQAAEAKFGKGCFDDETIEHVEQGEGESTPSNISKATMHDRQLIASVTDSEFQAYVDGCNSGQQPTPLRRKGKVK